VVDRVGLSILIALRLSFHKIKLEYQNKFIKTITVRKIIKYFLNYKT